MSPADRIRTLSYPVTEQSGVPALRVPMGLTSLLPSEDRPDPNEKAMTLARNRIVELETKLSGLELELPQFKERGRLEGEDAGRRKQAEETAQALAHSRSSVVIAIEAFAEELRSKRIDPLLGPATLSVGVIEGGTSVNTVPDRCRVEIDRRVLPGEEPRSLPGALASHSICGACAAAQSSPARMPARGPAKSGTLSATIGKFVSAKRAGLPFALMITRSHCADRHASARSRMVRPPTRVRALSPPPMRRASPPASTRPRVGEPLTRAFSHSSCTAALRRCLALSSST